MWRRVVDPDVGRLREALARAQGELGRQRDELDLVRADLLLLLGRMQQAGPITGGAPDPAALGEFARWLYQRYPVRERLPGCWPRHPAVVEVLGQLAVARSRPVDGMLWDELLVRALALIAEWVPEQCFRGRHLDDSGEYGEPVTDEP